MKYNVDIVVVGAGIVGLNTALQIVRRTDMKIAVVEKGAAPGEGSSGASSAICRHLYTHDEMIILARDGIDAYRNWQEYLGIDEPPSAEFQQIGVLWMGGESHRWGEEVDRLANMGVNAVKLTDEELRERFPAINPCQYAPDFESGEPHECIGAGAHLLETEAGYMDPQYALDDLAKVLKARGAVLRYRQEVTSLKISGARVTGVNCANGDQYNAACVINASGPWCNRLLEQIEGDRRWPLVPTRIQVLHLERPAELEGDIPVCADFASGVYFRPQNLGQQLIVGSTLPEDDLEAVTDPDEFNRLTDEHFTSIKMHALHHRLPALPYRGRVGGYSGLYTVNKKDMHPIVGETPLEGFFVANGFSGHGFKTAPAVGGLLAQAVTGVQISHDTTVSPDFLSYFRKPIELEIRSVLA